MRRSLLTACTAATALATLSLTTPASATNRPEEREPWVVRTADLRADAKEFRSLCDEPEEGAPEQLTFPLFPDGRQGEHDKHDAYEKRGKHGNGYTAVQDVLRQNEDGSVYWAGHDPKNPENTIAVTILGVCTGGPVTLSGVAQSGFRQYQYDPLHDRPGWYRLQEIDSLELPPSGQGDDTVEVYPPKDPKPPKPPKRPKPGLRAVTPNNPAAIDIVAAYTPATVTELGSVAAVQARISYGVNQLNSALAASNVPASVHVVDTYQTTATGVPRENANTLLNMISNPENLTLGAPAATRRAQSGADLVALFASIPAEDSSGSGSLPVPPTSTTSNAAFSVTSVFSVTAWENLAHEIGHNLGFNHDRETYVGTPPANTFNYGWVTPNQQHHTIMAYSSACDMPCKVVNQYSNTDNTFSGQILGNAMNNNARFGLDSAETVSGYNTSLVTNRTTLNLTANPVGGGSVRPSVYGPYAPGTTVTLTVTPNTGYTFSGWLVDGVLQAGTTPEHTITMNSNRTVVAQFTANP